jgi:hypothetical protein
LGTNHFVDELQVKAIVNLISFRISSRYWPASIVEALLHQDGMVLPP